MNIHVNGNTQNLPEACSLTSLLHLLELAEKCVAVEINDEVIPRSQHTTHVLAEGDRIEIIHAIGGG